MSTSNAEILCGLDAYEQARRERVQLTQLSSGEIYYLYLRISGEDAALQCMGRTPELPRHRAPSTMALELTFLDADFVPRFSQPGEMRNGIWMPGSAPPLVARNYNGGNPALVDGVLAHYEDDVSDAMWRVFEQATEPAKP